MKAYTLTFLGLLFISVLDVAQVSAADLEEAQTEIMADLQTAQKTLSATEKRIGNERSEISNKLNQTERELRVLQDKTAAARRLSDEATLSLQQLRKRSDAWDEQARFQTNLLNRFKQQVNGENWSTATNMNEKISWLNNHIKQQQSGLYQQWQQQEVVMPKGTMESAEILSLGPVTWFWQEDKQQGGFINVGSDRPEVTLILDGNHAAELGKLQQSQTGTIIFDPTLSRALVLAQEKESFLQHVEKGGIWALPILGFAVFALSISLLKAIQLWRLPQIQPLLAERLMKLEETNDLANNSNKREALVSSSRGMQQELLSIALNTKPGQARDDQLFSHLMGAKHKLEYWLGAIAITASVSPLLGLLGTVSGMIEAFRLMTLFGAGDPSAVSGGISEALVTTELGLIVAIPSLVLHALLSRWVKSYFAQLEACAITLCQLQASPETKLENPSIQGALPS